MKRLAQLAELNKSPLAHSTKQMFARPASSYQPLGSLISRTLDDSDGWAVYGCIEHDSSGRSDVASFATTVSDPSAFRVAVERREDVGAMDRHKAKMDAWGERAGTTDTYRDLPNTMGRYLNYISP